MSYRDLEARSGMVARMLLDCAPPGLPVVVAVPRSNELLAALLGVLKAGLAYLPVDPYDPPARLTGVLETAGSRVALVTSDTEPILAGQGLRTLDVEALGEVPSAAETAFDPLPEVSPEQPVYVLFTSGSTGAPKGVILPSLALCNRLLWMHETYGVVPEDRILQKTPITFDVSGWELFLPLISGATCVFLPPEEHRDPILVARAIIENQITVCHFVPSMLREFLRWPDADGCTTLRHVFCSGEVLPVALARTFVSQLPARLHNLYGPTEAAIDVTSWTCPERAEDIDRILIGKPIDNCVLGVFGEDGRPVASGEAGELRIGGMPLALGYLNRQDLTSQAFVHADANASVPMWYRTGDRVRLLAGGLEYLGRIDDQVKIRGQRIEPQEVEHHLAGHPDVAACVVVAAQVGDNTELVAWIQPTARHRCEVGVEVEASPEAAPTQEQHEQLARRLYDHLADRLPPAYLPFRFLLVSELPFNSSGKQDRKLLRQRAEQQLNARHLASETRTARRRIGLDQLRDPLGKATASAEDVVTAIWQEVFPYAQAADGSFLSLGGHSLLGARLSAELHHRLGVSLPASYFVSHDPTLAQLRDAATQADLAAPLPTLPVGAIPASPGQRRMWLLSKMASDSPAYNVVGALRIDRTLQPEPLATALAAIASRHCMLQSALCDDGTDVLLRIDPSVMPEILVEHGDPGYAAAFLRSRRDLLLDPERPPLYAVAALNVSDGTSILVVTLHHAIADQRSLDIFLDELSVEYGRATRNTDVAIPTPAAAGDYRQYSVLQRQLVGTKVHLDYWRKALEDAPTEADLPFRLRPISMPSFAGGSVTATLDEDAGEAVRALVVRARNTPATVFLTAAALVLARWTSSDEVVMGVAVSARERAEFQRTIGFFVDTVPVRLSIRDRPSMATALERIRAALACGVEHSAVPFDEVVGALRPDRDSLRNPLFQTWFNDLSEASQHNRFAGSPAEVEEVPVGWSLFELGFYVNRDQGRYRLQVVHAVDRYGPDVAQALLEQWRTALLAMTADLEQVVTAFGIEVPSPGIDVVPCPAAPVTGHGTVRDLVGRVLAMSQRTPMAAALLGPDGERRSYSWLGDAVLRCSAALSDRVMPSGVVAVVSRRDVLLPVALLGSWHSGCAVLLLDSETPERWQQDAIRQTGAAVVLRVGGAAPAVSDLLVLDVADLLTGPPGDSAGAAFRPDFSHALLTSGTTGEPAVVRVPADALPTAFAWYSNELKLGPSDVFCALAGAGHDPILREMVLPLTIGASVAVPSHAERFDPARLLQVVRGQHCTVISLTPGHARLLPADARPVPHIRVISCYGAPLTDTVARRLRRLAPNAELYNVYGTTETPQAASVYRWNDPEKDEMGRTPVRPSVPVGIGTGYCTLEVQTSSGSPSAVGQLGEIVVTGATVRGACHTGDLGRRTPDGDVEVCGRIDRQLLVGGHRVEPASVEAVLTGLTGIAGAAVGLHPESSDTLIALVVLVPGHWLGPDRIRRQLRRALPAWSIPEVIEVEAIPLTRNGKPDFRTLPSVLPLQGRNGERRTAPATDSQKLEVLIGDVVRDVCGHAVEPDQQFFDAGLNSFDMLRLHRRLRPLIDGDINVVELFQFPTIRSLADHLTAACSAVTTAGLRTETELQARRAARNAVRFL